MLDILSYRIDLWKSQRRKRKVIKSYERQRDEAKKKSKSAEEIGTIDNDYFSQMDYMDDRF